MGKIIKSYLTIMMFSSMLFAVESNELTIKTGILKFNIKPNVSGDNLNQAVRYLANGQAQINKNTVTEIGTTLPNGCSFYPAGCPIDPLNRVLYMTNDGVVYSKNTITIGDSIASFNSRRWIYSFKYPSYSVYEAPITATDKVECSNLSPSYYSCIAEKLVAQDSSLNTTTTQIIIDQGISVTNVSIVDEPQKVANISKRLVMKNWLHCPIDFSSNWEVSKYDLNGSFVTIHDVSGTTTTTIPNNFYVNTTEQDYQLQDSVGEMVNSTLFEQSPVYNIVSFLDPDKLAEEVCEKKVCPNNFKNSSTNKNLCVATISSIKMNKAVPKKLYLIYPTNKDENQKRIYSVPNVASYFGKADGNINDIEVKFINDSDQVVDSYSPSGFFKVELVNNNNDLQITVNKNNDAEMIDNQIIQTGFTLVALQEMKDFPNRKLGMTLPISIDILSSIYETGKEELYRCQALEE